MTITQASAMHMLHEGVRQLQMYARPHANRCGASMTSSLLNSRIRRGNACFLRFSSLEVHAPHTEATRARTKLREAADALFGSQGSTRRRSWAAREVGRLSSELFTAEYGEPGDHSTAMLQLGSGSTPDAAHRIVGCTEGMISQDCRSHHTGHICKKMPTT
eukprot:1571456-Pleurochrysis_carterae.AAC.1